MAVVDPVTRFKQSDYISSVSPASASVAAPNSISAAAIQLNHQNAPIEPAPILSGSAEVTLLSLGVALAAFLRTLSLAAEDKIEDIQAHPDSIVYPFAKYHTKKRLNLLHRTVKTIERTAPLLIFWVLICSIRMTLHALTLLFPVIPSVFFLWYDLLLIVVFTLMLIGMFYAHFALTPEHRSIRLLKEAHVEEHAGEGPAPDCAKELDQTLNPVQSVPFDTVAGTADVRLKLKFASRLNTAGGVSDKTDEAQF